MKIEHTYCDVCQRQMDWHDSSGDQNVNGFEIEGRLSIGANVRTDSGSCGWQASTFHYEHVCSSDCMKHALNKLMEAVLEKPVPALEEQS